MTEGFIEKPPKINCTFNLDFSLSELKICSLLQNKNKYIIKGS